MSRHLFSTTLKDAPVTVVAGWDPQLQCFFLDIDKEDDDECDPLYSSDFDRRLRSAKTFGPYIEKLAELGITIPKAMIDALSEDKRNNTANRVNRWDAKGS